MAEQQTPQGNMVRIANRLPQTLTVTVDGGSGAPLRQIVLAGNATSDPVPESSLTEYTRGLARQDRVRIRTA